MRICLLILIIFSNLLLFPLAKNDLLFSKNRNCKKNIGEVSPTCNQQPAQISNEKKIIHKVAAGESISSIAEKYNVPMAALLDRNHLSIHDRIFRGQKLLIFVSQKENLKNRQLNPGQSISLYKPVGKWEIIKGYIPYGDAKNFGLLCRVTGNAGIKPASSGTVVKISHLRGYGIYILIDHGNGWHTMYSNLDEVKVKSGQYVNFSETIGNAKNQKLFFLLAYNGKPVNPTGYFLTTARD